MLQATREAAQSEKVRREKSEKELIHLYKVVADFIYHTDSYNRTLIDSEIRVKEYLRKIGLIK